ncbi:MAG TPA: AMP-binding protein [Phycisphaerae bacterium]|nr:AMP-binding protein [Phycisphaerae bacterium]
MFLPSAQDRSDARTLPEALRAHAAGQPERLLYRFLPTGEPPALEWTFAETDRRARAVAARLLHIGAPGRPVLLAHSAGLDFIAGFLGTLYAGAIAVPVLPPRANGHARRPAAERFAAILHAADPAAILASSALAPALAWTHLPLIPLDSLDPAPETLDLPAPDPAAPACIQFTSGTSGTPRGVMLSHAALVANARMIAAAFGHTPESRGVIWLPPHHDMGLIGGILQPLFVGFEVTLMPATAFLQRPMRWLEAVSRHRATTSGGPTFAYALCAQSPAEPKETLDLSSWDVAFVGAEPVRSATLQRFAGRFAPSGFRASAMLPCYGLAEATLMVSAAPRGAGIHVADSPAGAPCVDCGPAVPPAEILIVDPATHAPLPENAAGEVWLRSPALGDGYWRRPDLTRDAFHAQLPGDPYPCLRTGDLGFLRAGHLHITGRLKDLLIVRGVNHMAHDIEATAESAHPALQPAGCAAFALNTDAGEAVALACELRRDQRREDPSIIVQAIRDAIAQTHDLELAAILLLPPGALPRTTSGKIQRALCRERHQTNAWQPLHLWTPAASDAPCAPGPPSLDRAAIAQWLTARLARVANIPAQQIDPAEPIVRYGIGSADAVGLAGEISAALHVDLPAMALWDYPTIAELAGHLSREIAGLSEQPS